MAVKLTPFKKLGTAVNGAVIRKKGKKKKR